MKKTFKITLASALVCASTFALASDDGFQIHGYVRADVVFDSEEFADIGLNTSADQLGSLGNQHDSFMAVDFVKHWEGENGSWAEYTFGLVTLDSTPDDHGNNILTPETGTNVFKMGGLDFMPEGSNVWVGTRKIASDISLVDQKYRNLHGTGFGYESKNFDLTVMKQFHPGDTGEHDEGTAVDAVYRTSGIEAEVTYVYLDADTNILYDDHTATAGDSSVSVRVAYTDDKFLFALPGSTTYSVQYGSNTDAKHMNWTYVADGVDAYRVVLDGKYAMSQSLALSTVGYYEAEQKDSGDINTIVVGGNLAQTLNNNVGMEYQAFYAYETESEAATYKVAAGPTLQLKTLPFVRPILKADVAYFNGNDESGQESEVQFSVSAEAFF